MPPATLYQSAIPARWSALAPLLAGHFSVIAFDWPGMGYSDPWPGGVTPQHMAGRLLELMDTWRIDRAHLMGIDMGGQPALVFAAGIYLPPALVAWFQHVAAMLR